MHLKTYKDPYPICRVCESDQFALVGLLNFYNKLRLLIMAEELGVEIIRGN